MSKSITAYLASNGCFAQDGDTIYLAVGDDALAVVATNIQKAQAGVDFTLEVTQMEVPELVDDQLQVIRVGSGWKLFTKTEAFVFPNTETVVKKIADLATTRFGDYAPGVDYTFSIPIEPADPEE